MENVKGITKIQLLLYMANFSLSWQKVRFATPNRRMTPHINGKKCTKKTYTLMQLIFN
jgi:hypothetical protein